ncbi:DUF6778 family protein [Tabrizicola sp.]|jgi:hypothetical protein|uniref:DUF6778 family protein n=1 Tax=Tabrizicola sp. TaxID=2005166 RepID=UPI001A4970CB|nr:DUF6778 family protein [Tabrizicola sp.]MBL9061901.1 hypothetical protein [Tabrizicola sp.]
MSTTRRTILLGLTATLLSACVGGGTFKTEYDPVPAALAKSWRLAEVRVSVPKSLSVSEAKTLLPNADIVWREDPLGDRHAQVGKIIQNAVLRGAQGLRGSTPVIISVTVTRFHALTYEAELSSSDWGVHNVDFIAEVVDARTGAVLLPATKIRAETPAWSGARMKAARAKGVTQKSMITNHVAATVAGWLGLGPDNRGTFSRKGN